MVEIYFYQSDGPPANLLMKLLEKCRSMEWKILLLCSGVKEVDFFHEQLWVQPNNRFLGLGKIGSEFDPYQPVLISDKLVYTNNPHVMIANGNSKVEPDEVTKFVRVMVIFNQNDKEELQASRKKWKTFSGLGYPMKLFSQEKSNWKLKAEANTVLQEEI